MELKKIAAAESYLASSGIQKQHGLKLLEKLNPFQGRISKSCFYFPFVNLKLITNGTPAKAIGSTEYFPT